ncbi:MAG: porin family protein [Bacteroidota bacterium]
MKKIFTTLFMLLGFYSLTQAQSRNKNEFGIDIGYNGAYLMANNSYESTDVASGFNIGLSVDHYFSRTWSLKVKAIYDQKGWANGYIINNDNNTTINGVDFKLNYITVPVMANLHFGRTKNWYFDFGPYIGFLTEAHANYQNLDVTDMVNSTDGGLAMGIGVKIPLSHSTRFFIEYDGQSGVAHVFRGSYDNAQNVRGSFNVGLNF